MDEAAAVAAVRKSARAQHRREAKARARAAPAAVAAAASGQPEAPSPATHCGRNRDIEKRVHPQVASGPTGRLSSSAQACRPRSSGKSRHASGGACTSAGAAGSRDSVADQAATNASSRSQRSSHERRPAIRQPSGDCTRHRRPTAATHRHCAQGPLSCARSGTRARHQRSKPAPAHTDCEGAMLASCAPQPTQTGGPGDSTNQNASVSVTPADQQHTHSESQEELCKSNALIDICAAPATLSTKSHVQQDARD